MSAYIILTTPMTDEECLLAALADVGFDRSKVEVHTTPTVLVGYAGDARTQAAHVIVRRKHLASASNDLGFLATDTGYRAIVSDYDQSRFGGSWLAALAARCQAHWEAKRERLAADERARLEAERRQLVEAQRTAILARARALGYQVEETREGEVIRLALVRRRY